MSSSVLTCYSGCGGKSYEDLSAIRLTPLPRDNYRCPVSTPANYMVHPDGLRRTKTLPGISLQHRSAAGGARRYSTRQRSIPCWSPSCSSPQVSNSFEMSFVDKKADTKETHQNHWLKSLCSQPVEEILNKYRRKNEFVKTQQIVLKTVPTPGEKSLLSAWENNINQGRYHTSVGGVKPARNGVSHFRTQIKQEHQHVQQMSSEQQFRNNVSGKFSGGKVSNSYLQNMKDLNGFLQDDCRISKKTCDMLQTSYQTWLH